MGLLAATFFCAAKCWAAGDDVSEKPPSVMVQASANVGEQTSYIGLPVKQISFSNIPFGTDQDYLLQLIPQKIAQPLDRDLLRQSIRKLYDTGRFADIRIEGEKIDGGVAVSFITAPNYFIGIVTVDGNSNRPSANQ